MRAPKDPGAGAASTARLACEAVLEALHHPVWLLRADGHIDYANEAAIAQRRGRLFGIQDNAIRRAGHLSAKEWTALLDRATAAVVRVGIWAWSQDRLDTGLLHLHPMPAQPPLQEAWPTAALVLNVCSFDRQAEARTREQALAARFKLTTAEAALLHHLRAGATIEEIAALRNVRVTTVRTQLRHLVEKAGVRRQIDLVRMAGGL